MGNKAAVVRGGEMAIILLLLRLTGYGYDSFVDASHVFLEGKSEHAGAPRMHVEARPRRRPPTGKM